MHYFFSFLLHTVVDLKKKKKEQTKYSMSINEESEYTNVINLVWLFRLQQSLVYNQKLV